jgi:uncharacterized protein YcaQ
MINDNGKIYFAGPWFNEAQAQRYEAVLEVLRDWEAGRSGRSLFVPREHLCPPTADEAKRLDVYETNLVHLRDAAAVVAITDEKDLGTIYELGYAARLRDERRESGVDVGGTPELVGVALTLGDRPFNLMVAVGLDAACRSLFELRELLLEGRRPPTYRGVIE